MKRVVSVSIGSAKRDKEAEITLLGERVHLRREGVPGLAAARERIAALDGEVDAIGLGGIDLYLFAGSRRYTVRDALPLARAATRTPVVDGSGLKDTLERETVLQLDRGPLPMRERKVLLTVSVDRFGMAQTFARAGADVVFGDLMFALGLPIPLRGERLLETAARLVLPVAVRLPFTVLYPTGASQEAITPRFERWYRWAEVIAGDWHYIRRYMPPELPGKTILTNTVRVADIELLRERGVSALVTTTPQIDGESFGTNVMEAALVAVTGRSITAMPREEVRELLNRLGWEPRVQRIAETTGANLSSQ